MKSPVELNSLSSKFFCYITWLLYQLIRRDSERLVNEAFTSNTIVSWKQQLNGLKIKFDLRSINQDLLLFRILLNKQFIQVIVLFNTVLCRPAFSTVSFRKLVFRFSVLSLNQDNKICVIMPHVVLFSSYIKTYIFLDNKLFTKVLRYHVKTRFHRCFEFFKKKNKNSL